MGCMMVIGQRIGTRAVSNEDLFPLKPVIKAMISPNPNRKSRRLSQSIIGLNSTRDIKDFYDIENGRLLGSGASGPVRVCVHKGTQLEFALKRLSKLKLAPDKLDQLRIEIAIMADLDHPNILRLLEYFETDDEIYLILEICRGGELLDHLHDSPDHKYTEAVACKLIYTMLSAVRYCHAHNIVHRDLKLENFLFENENHDSQLKLIGENIRRCFHIDLIHLR